MFCEGGGWCVYHAEGLHSGQGARVTKHLPCHLLFGLLKGEILEEENNEYTSLNHHNNSSSSITKETLKQPLSPAGTPPISYMKTSHWQKKDLRLRDFISLNSLLSNEGGTSPAY